ncbi:MAG TPA: putative Ig domain-containing protein, partial [Rhodocyclaceae bacterium]|nr:putative Ig domain-containing protein [Rhodocyclaceae bacterium]
ADDGHGGTVSDSFALSLGDVNDAPTQVSSIPDQAFSGAGAWSFTLPAGVFHDADNDTLSLSARQADGSALPGWLSFDAATGSFTGVPPFGRTPVDIVVVARDGHSGEVTAGFHFESNVPPPPLAPEPQAPTVLFVPPPPPRVIPDAPPTAPPSPFLPPGSPVALVNPSFDSPPPVSAPLPAVPVPPERPGSDRAPVLAAPPDALPPGSSPLVSVGPLPDGLPAASTRGGLVVTRPDQGAFDVVPARANTITLSAGTFVETVPGVSVSVSAMLDNGQALPPWISFNPGTGTLLVNPPPGLKRDVTIRIVARDQNGQEAVTFVRVRVGSQRTTSSLTPAADALREVRPQVMPLDDLTRPDGSAALPARPVADVARPAGHTGRDSLASQLQRAGRGPGVSGRLQAIAQAAEAARRDGA